MTSTFGKTALAVAILALMAGSALAAGPGGDTATGNTQAGVTTGAMGTTQNSAMGTSASDNSGQTTTRTNVNAGMHQTGNNANKGKVDGSAAGGITK